MSSEGRLVCLTGSSVLGVIISVDDDDVVYVDVVMLLVIDDIVVNGDLHEVCVDDDHMSDVSD